MYPAVHQVAYPLSCGCQFARGEITGELATQVTLEMGSECAQALDERLGNLAPCKTPEDSSQLVVFMEGQSVVYGP